MALFKDRKEHFIEGNVYFNQGKYDFALREYQKSFEKGNPEAFLKVYNTLKNLKRHSEAYQFLIDNEKSVIISINDRLSAYDKIIADKISDDVRKFVYMKKAAAYKPNEYYRKLMEFSASKNDIDGIFEYGEDYLNVPDIHDNIKLYVYEFFLRYINYTEKIDPFRSRYVNGKYGKYDFVGILNEIIKLKDIPDFKRTNYIIHLVRYYLIDYFYRKAEHGTITYYESYRQEAIRDIEPLLMITSERNCISNYYLALWYTFIFGKNKINYSKAKEAMNALRYVLFTLREKGEEDNNFKEELEALRNSGALDNLNNYINSSQQISINQTNMNDIIGNSEFKKILFEQLEIINLQFSDWERTSNFSMLTRQKSINESYIYIFDGEDGNAKRTLAERMNKSIASATYKTPTFKELDLFKINSKHSGNEKFNYITDEIGSLGNDECRMIYIDKPYEIRNNDQFDVFDTTIKYLMHLMEGNNEGIFQIVFAGNGDLIRSALTSAGVKEYMYKTVQFYGYSVDEAMILLERIMKSENENGVRLSIPDEIMTEIKHIIQLKNNNSSRNVNYYDIKYIFTELRSRQLEINRRAKTSEKAFSDCIVDVSKNLGVESKEEADFNKIMEELDGMAGLANIKKQMRKLIHNVKINQMRRDAGFKTIDNSLHMVFAGNPGTGKTTVAKMMGKILKELKVLTRGHVVEVSRTDLVDIYVGGTANKTRNVLNRALGGVLFIDEAYSLTNNNSSSYKDYGIEALEEILKFMSDHSSDLCVIVAGYTKEMQDFIDTNPGLQSRFNTWVEFEDYSVEELYYIFENLCKENEFIIDEEVKPYILKEFKDAKEKGKNFGNARFVNNYFKDLVSKLSDNLSYKYMDSLYGTPSKEELQTFTKDIFEATHTNNFMFKNYFDKEVM